MKGIIQSLVLLMLGVLLAASLRAMLFDGDGLLAWGVSQVAIVAAVGGGLVMTDRTATAADDFRRCLPAWVIFVSVQIMFIVFALFGVLESQAVAALAQASLASFGWYPRGADAWFPVSVLIWAVSTLMVVMVSIGVAQFLRGALLPGRQA